MPRLPQLVVCRPRPTRWWAESVWMARLGSSSSPACSSGPPREPPIYSCGAGSPAAGPVASPSVPCSWPARGWSPCVRTTRISIWLGRGGSVAAFAALVLFHGMLVAAVAGRLSRAVPLLAPTPRAMIAHVPLLLLALGSVALVAAIVGVVVVLASQIPAVAGAWRDRRSVTAGRVVLVLVVLVALPSFASAVIDILGRP